LFCFSCSFIYIYIYIYIQWHLSSSPSLCIIEIAYVFRASVHTHFKKHPFVTLSIFDNYYNPGPNACESVLCITISLFRFFFLSFFTCRTLELITVYTARIFLAHLSRKKKHNPIFSRTKGIKMIEKKNNKTVCVSYSKGSVDTVSKYE
jgi:hypothetical protein